MERYVIHVTKQCNMVCAYCYEKDRESTYTWEEIEELCNNIIEYNKSGVHYSVEFLGGEPCLAFDYVKKAVALFKEKDPEHCDYFIITTNGTILNDDIANFLLQNPDVCYSISLDGTKEANKYRVLNGITNANSYDIITYNIRCLIELYKVSPRQLSIHMVTHPLNVKHIYEGVKDIYDMGIRSISMGTAEVSYMLTENYKEKFIEEMNRVSDSILNGELEGMNIDILQDFDTEKPRGRIYIRDKNGKMIGESYAEASDDITKSDIYNSNEVGSNIQEFIFNLRRTVCLYYRGEKEKCLTQK